MRTLLFVAVAFVVLQDGSAHQMKFGRCKAATPVQNFDPQRFNGTWYVIEQLVTSSKCLMTMFNATGNNTMTIQEMRAPLVTQAFPIEVTFTNVGTLDMDSTNKAKMKLRWSGNFLNKIISTTFTVVATDYTSYALEVECQSWGLFHRISVTIHSRTNSLPNEVVTDLRKQLKDKFGIDLSRLSKIDHNECMPLDQTQYNIKYDENGLSLLGLLNDKNLTTFETVEEVEEYLGIKPHDHQRNLTIPSNHSYAHTEMPQVTGSQTEKTQVTSPQTVTGRNFYSNRETSHLPGDDPSSQTGRSPVTSNYPNSQTERSYVTSNYPDSQTERTQVTGRNSYTQTERSYVTGRNSFSRTESTQVNDNDLYSQKGNVSSENF